MLSNNCIIITIVHNMGLRWTILDLGKHYLPTNHLFTDILPKNRYTRICSKVHPNAAALATELDVPSRKLMGLKMNIYLFNYN